MVSPRRLCRATIGESGSYECSDREYTYRRCSSKILGKISNILVREKTQIADKKRIGRFRRLAYIVAGITERSLRSSGWLMITGARRCEMYF